MKRLCASKYIGCMFGAAIGDALGMPVTGRTRSEIALLGGVDRFMAADATAPLTLPLTALAEGEVEDPLAAGQWTDDTQLTLALAETLTAERGLFVPDAWAHALVRWLNNSPRAPGLSSVEAAVQLRTGGAEWDEAADPDGGGCGAATRAAPIALAYPIQPAVRRRCAYLQAATTHGHPDAHAAAIAVAEAVAIVLPLGPDEIAAWDGAAFIRNVADAVAESSAGYAEMTRCLELARTLLLDGIEAETAVRVLGVSAWAREAVPTAIYLVASRPRDLPELILSAVNMTGGAVESIATMVGAIGGALHGSAALPGSWRREVEDGPRLLATALALHAIPTWKATGAV